VFFSLLWGRSYAQHIRLVLHYYCLLLPFALLPQMRYVTPVAALLITHALLGVEDIGLEVPACLSS
jgi:predicted membrane chloride channel (bestrophin family)